MRENPQDARLGKPDTFRRYAASPAHLGAEASYPGAATRKAPVEVDVVQRRYTAARHRAFHSAIIAACDSTWLTRLWDQLTSHEERYRRIAMHGGQWPESVAVEVEREHHQIAEAVLSRDIEQSWKKLRRHRRRTVAAVRNAFADHPRPWQEIVREAMSPVD